LCDLAALEQRCEQPTRCDKFRLLILLNQSYIFRETNSPILISTFDCTYSFWYNAPTLLPTGDTVGMELVPSRPCHQSAAVSVHCTKSCVYRKKCSWGWAKLSPETCRVDLKGSISGICCLTCWSYQNLLLKVLHLSEFVS
jgi:hypothetical protein